MIAMDRDTAEAVMQLEADRRFLLFKEWLSSLHGALVSDAINGVSEQYGPEVLRGRAQALQILRREIDRAPDVVRQHRQPHELKGGRRGIA